MAKQWKDAIEVDVAAISENDWNPNEVDAAMQQQLVENIRKAGFNQPLVVREIAEGQYEVVDGAHRFRAAKQIGMAKVPVIVRPFTTAEAKTQTIAMNKLRGEMDPAAVARLIREVESDGIDLDELAAHSGYDGLELDTLLTDFPELDGAASAAGAEPSGPAGRGDPIIAYNLVFDDKPQQEVWFSFIRHLRSHYKGETIAERLTIFLTENVLLAEAE